MIVECRHEDLLWAAPPLRKRPKGLKAPVHLLVCPTCNAAVEAFPAVYEDGSVRWALRNADMATGRGVLYWQYLGRGHWARVYWHATGQRELVCVETKDTERPKEWPDWEREVGANG